MFFFKKKIKVGTYDLSIKPLTMGDFDTNLIQISCRVQILKESNDKYRILPLEVLKPNPFTEDVCKSILKKIGECEVDVVKIKDIRKEKE